MSTAFAASFEVLKGVLASFANRLAVQKDTPAEYTLVTKTPSPFKQHKGHPLSFGSVRLGKAYVSYHLVPLYMCPPLQAMIPAALKKRMQGKACFNFKAVPDPELLAELATLTDAALKRWSDQKWT